MAKRQTPPASSKPAPAAAPAPQDDQAPDPVIEMPEAPPEEPPEDVPLPAEQLPEPPPIEVAKAEPAPAAAPAPDLDDFIAMHEKAAQAVDLVVTAISHPTARPRHHAGVYSGFPITTGELLATYNDGSTH
jgi:hypothetical protein